MVGLQVTGHLEPIPKAALYYNKIMFQVESHMSQNKSYYSDAC